MSLLAVDLSREAANPRPARPGAFDWWYADARDDAGDGLVVIFASRLPFLDAEESAVNLCLYRRGRPAFWLLEHWPRAVFDCLTGGARLGASTLARPGTRACASCASCAAARSPPGGRASRAPAPSSRAPRGARGDAGRQRLDDECAELARAARSPWLLFVDADVRVQPGGVAALVDTAAAARADVVTAVPRQQTRTFAERLVVPLLHFVYFAFAPLFLVERVGDPRVVAANGQLLLARRERYAAFGGHACPSVRGAVVEDQAFCRAAKAAGLRVSFVDGHRAATCRMYAGARQVRDGFAKNLYPGVGGTPATLALALGLVAWTSLVPFVALPFAPAAALPGVAALLALRLALAVRFSQPLPEAVLLHPVGATVIVLLGLDSALRVRRGAVRWRGRVVGAGEGSFE